MTHRFALAALPLIVGAFAAAAAAMPPADAWEIGPIVRGRNYSEGMPATPAPRGAGWAFEFPQNDGPKAGQIDAVTHRPGSLAGAREIIVRYRIDAAPGTRFVAHEQPDQPATVSLYFQRAGDTWSAKGRYQYYRWYTPVEGIRELAPGRYELRVPLTDLRWTSVMGRPASNAPAAFADALAETDRIGLAFGTSSRRSHGVYTTGPARFTLESFTIR